MPIIAPIPRDGRRLMQKAIHNLLPEWVQDMRTWEPYCRFAREPESRKVAIDARIKTGYEVEPDMAGAAVMPF